jgi:DNA-binding response OmpR family regulator
MPHRVLIVEDDAGTARYEQTILERAGFETKAVDSGASGLEVAATFSPDIVLLDVGLPDISGLDVLTTLANQSDAYILMVSAHSSEDDKLAALGLGADDYITKPFSGNELVARVQAFIRRLERTKARTDEGTL